MIDFVLSIKKSLKVVEGFYRNFTDPKFEIGQEIKSNLMKYTYLIHIFLKYHTIVCNNLNIK